MQLNKGEIVYSTDKVYDIETGMLRRHETKLNGLKHSPPDDTPSRVVYDRQGRLIEQQWHAYGENHRLTGPSVVLLYPETGIHMTEAYEIRGKPRPANEGPYRVRRREDGSIWQQEFANPDGTIQRQNQPRLDR